ncbi:RNA-binding-like protein [Curvularia clavata]|uniref:RNA-binding-like protein n=1 Tax=Curvularia clavata TaxID=95742 RepID=A0A9Q8Z3K2_CURCL|nr:RNA-binding-like protein [Curvularia clavata]
MNSIRAIQELNKRELEAGISPEGSWHTDYRDTAFIYIGGLPFELTEGDIITIFSQYGEPVWIKLARDKETGKSRGFAWIKYEDQRSCDLAVDNLGGANIMDRIIRVDHARYKPKDDEDMRDNTMGEVQVDPEADSDSGRRKRRKTESESDSDEDRPLLPEEIELGRLMEKLDEEDPMRESLIKRQQEKVDDAVKRMKKQRRKEKERSRRKDRHRDGSRNMANMKSGIGVRDGKSIEVEAVTEADTTQRTDIVDTGQNETEIRVRILEITTESATVDGPCLVKERGGARAQRTHDRLCHIELARLNQASESPQYLKHECLSLSLHPGA